MIFYGKINAFSLNIHNVHYYCCKTLNKICPCKVITNEGGKNTICCPDLIGVEDGGEL